MLPNRFPDAGEQPEYNTVDATLWFFEAVRAYLEHTGDEEFVRAELYNVLVDIIYWHVKGTRYNIHADQQGLLYSGEEGVQLTWMDAKVGDWVVTPRRGKAVEINALWYNALCLLHRWLEQRAETEAARQIADHARRARVSFNERFWYDRGGYLYDVVDGPDGDSGECRPNQLLAISLPHPVLERERWARVMDVVQRRLLTPVGLRSLAPGSPAYREKYYGDLRARDAAYHQGTVWAWLIGPWIDAWLKLHPADRPGARAFLNGLIGHLNDFGVGSIAEIFDAEEPYTPRGCIAQAWSVAEVLRCWVKTSDSAAPSAR
jgi:predicted glycogen debranching enzyme